MQSVKEKNGVRHKKRKIDRSTLQVYSMCVIPLLLIVVFNYLPMIGTIIAFKDYKYDLGILGSKWVGFKNFEYLLKSNDFVRVTRNTLGLNFMFIIVGMFMAVTVAVLLFEVKSRRATKVYQTIMITPNFLSWVVVSYMVYAFLNPAYGLLNQFLGKIGIESIDWYSKPNAWPFILLIANVWKGVGMDSVIYYATLMGIDESLLEAADIDGASKWKKIKCIILPELTQLMVVLGILKIGNIFRADFGLFYQLTRDVGALYPTTDVIDTYIFRTMRVIGNMGMSSAAGLLQSVVGFALVVATNAISKKIDPNNGLF